MNYPGISLYNSENVIELSIGSKDELGKNVEYVLITVGFMNPDDKTKAKNLYIKKINLLSEILKLNIPTQVITSIKAERDVKTQSGKYYFEVENFGTSRKWISLQIN